MGFNQADSEDVYSLQPLLTDFGLMEMGEFDGIARLQKMQEIDYVER